MTDRYVEHILERHGDAEEFRKQYENVAAPKKPLVVVAYDRFDFIRYYAHELVNQKRDALFAVSLSRLRYLLEGKSPETLDIVYLELPKWWDTECDMLVKAHGFDAPLWKPSLVLPQW